jgi:hypothetical protein
MSTNFYLRALPACAHCGRGPDRGLHIGKLSAGWCFALRVYPRGEHYGDPAPRNLAEWIPRFAQGVINEYGETVTADEMVATITRRQPQGGTALHRHAAHPAYCLGPGDGPYDLMIGEFT